MVKLFKNIFLFLLFFIGVVFLVVLLPDPPRWNDSLHYVQVDKDSLMQNVEGPRLILLGGSNVGMSVDSQMLKDSLGVNPVNGGLHAGFGLKFVLDNAAQYLKSGDVVVVIPEYEQYDLNVFYGDVDLLKLLFDVAPEKISLINFEQSKYILTLIPSYIKIKLLPSSYFYRRASRPIAYLKSAYNAYGDAVAHWDDRNIGQIELLPLAERPEMASVAYLDGWIQAQKKKGVIVYLSYPAFEKKNYESSIGYISQVDSLIRAKDINVLGFPEDFVMDKSCFYDTRYHMNRRGVLLRTEKIIRLLCAENDKIGKE
ncbi:hypothetical protein [Dysgonomonas massiliensis]|uniref:hypothetical protein n=1 Tax=Dysgonomonas massiliensis TaxID=2040292 RepID=UPI000C77F5A5|nr:hypothetical protein [Dysgonomonas massiliensis]